MDTGLNGKVVAVTGGATGIGKAAALAFLEEGCKVAICGWIERQLEQTRREFKERGYGIVAETADVRKFAQLNHFTDTISRNYGRIDVWINNAGIMPLMELMEMNEEEWDKVFDINVKAILFGSQIASRRMKETGGGVILNAASISFDLTAG